MTAIVQAAVGLISQRPFVEPLLELASPERWCVLLVSRRAARVFTGTRDHLVEVAHALDDVHRHHEQGGWSQARYQRGVETEVDRHIRASCALLADRLERRAFEGLLLAGPQELHHRVEHELAPELRRLVAGSFEVDVERATAEEVRERAMPSIEDAERAREQDALGRLEEGLAPSGRGAVGLEEVLQALGERRVDTLLLAHGYATPGVACPACGRLAASACPCPIDGATPEQRGDVIESAVELALEQAAEVPIVRHLRERLAVHGSIAALLRF